MYKKGSVKKSKVLLFCLFLFLLVNYNLFCEYPEIRLLKPCSSKSVLKVMQLLPDRKVCTISFISNPKVEAAPSPVITTLFPSMGTPEYEFTNSEQHNRLVEY